MCERDIDELGQVLWEVSYISSQKEAMSLRSSADERFL